MTAEKNASSVQGGLVSAFRTLREQWFLLAFMAGTLFWLRDTYDQFTPLPATVAAQAEELAALTEGVQRLEDLLEGEQASIPTAPALVLAQHGHRVDDARAGEWTTARLKRVVPIRSDCVAESLDVWVVDGEGRWFKAPTSLERLPELKGETELGFDVRIGAEAASGRASMLVQFTHDCGTHRQVQTAHRLPFRVIDN